MDISVFADMLSRIGIGFFVGVPDSRLKALVDYLMDNCGLSRKHIIAANEGNAAALAAGYYLATGRIPCVYLQNSGLGIIVNPIASLMSGLVYRIPCLFVIGWRGEPGVADEPHHSLQGQITLEILDRLGIQCMIVGAETTKEELAEGVASFKESLHSGEMTAFVIKQNAFYYNKARIYQNNYSTKREDIVACIAEEAANDVVVATTGKTSRELFEVRERQGQSHSYDFLTVGSMGHSSSIALGVALNCLERRVWCLDGDGAALMHLGAMATIGAVAPKNFIHVLINNEAHESVGGQPTVADNVDFCGIARSCRYAAVYRAHDLKELKAVLADIGNIRGPVFIEAKSAIGSRKDLGRPTITPLENKEQFMINLGSANI